MVGAFLNLEKHTVVTLVTCSISHATGQRSSSASSRAAWWRITPSVPPLSSCSNTLSSGISPTRGKSASSSKTTLTAPRRRGVRKVSFWRRAGGAVCNLGCGWKLQQISSFSQMRQSMNIAAVKRKRRKHPNRKASRGKTGTCVVSFDAVSGTSKYGNALLPPWSSIVNVPGESTLRRDFIRLQQENKERSEALRRQQLLQEQQLREQEEYKRQLLAERQKRIEQQKEQRRRLEEVSKLSNWNPACLNNSILTSIWTPRPGHFTKAQRYKISWSTFCHQSALIPNSHIWIGLSTASL